MRRWSILHGALIAGTVAAYPAMALESWVKTASVIGSYDRADPGYGHGRGRLLPTVVNGSLGRASHQAIFLAVVEAMHGVDAAARQAEAKTAWAPQRVVWQFDDAAWEPEKPSCIWQGVMGSSRRAARPLVARTHARVIATFCRDDMPVTEAVGFVPISAAPGTPEFADFILRMTDALFP